jgi:hypothetical protein
MFLAQPEVITNAVHFWNTISNVHVRLKDEPVTDSDVYCFNNIDYLNINGQPTTVPLYLAGSEDPSIAGEYSLDSFTGNAHIIIEPGYWAKYQDNAPLLEHTIAHEVGHALSMGHVKDAGAIMYPVASETLIITDQDLAMFNSAWQDPGSAPTYVTNGQF